MRNQQQQQAVLGDIVFSVYRDVAYESLTRTSDGGWVSTERANQSPGSQNTGPALDTIILSGSIIGPRGQQVLDNFRELQAYREAVTFVKGNGDYLGLWKMMRVKETQKRIVDNGNSTVTTYTIELEHYKK